MNALLIGNDINNATASYSWSDLLNGLIEFAGVDNMLSLDNKPFPLLYEEIYLSSAKSTKIKEIELKRFIAKETNKLAPNDIHHELLKLGIENIFTTNYDLTLEKAINSSEGKLRNQGVIKENLYSLFRYHRLKDKNIWHIHGSQRAPNTITLGYEHYGGYLQQMRNYLISGIKGRYQGKDFEPLTNSIIFDRIKHHSWMDYFFSHNVFILGLNLDFVEMHLWWLLTIRTRMMITERVSVSNKIIYYYPEMFHNSSKAKLDLFNINGIETVPVEMKKNGQMEYYMKVIENIRKRV